MNTQELREKRASLVSDMEAILASAEADERLELDDDEATMYAEAEADLAKVDAAIERRQSLDAKKASLSEPEPAKLHAQGAGEPARTAPEAKREFESVGEFMGAVVKHYRGRGDDPRLSWDDGASIQAADQSMSDGASGGFLVPSQFRDTLLMVDPQESIIMGRSNLMEAGDPPDAEITMPALDQTGSAPDNVYGGVEMNWIGEGDTKPSTGANFREVSLRPHELAGHTQITDKLLRNAAAFSSQVESLMRGALMSAQEFAMFDGDGIAKPLGMLNAGATITQARAVANQVSYEDLVSMMSKHMMGGSYWLINQSALPQIMQLQDPNGNYVWQPNAVEGSPGSLFGYPVFWHQRSKALGTKGDVMLVNSNPYYMVKPGSGPFVSMGYAGDDFVNNKSRIKVFTNVDAKPWLTEPFKQENGHEVSPFVALGDVSN